MKPPVDVSPEAAAELHARLATRGTPSAAVRMGVRGGACSGFAYAVEIDDDPARTGDHEWSVGGVAFRVDRKSAVHLNGSRLVFRRSLLRTGFDFENPNEASRCGCGGSFAPR